METIMMMRMRMMREMRMGNSSHSNEGWAGGRGIG